MGICISTTTPRLTLSQQINGQKFKIEDLVRKVCMQIKAFIVSASKFASSSY